jgi:hypothetical protein
MMDDQLKHIERTRKPIKCPTCGKPPLASILYGYPNYNEELEQEMQEGRIVLGGCMMEVDDPVWECSFCGQKIHKK